MEKEDPPAVKGVEESPTHVMTGQFMNRVMMDQYWSTMQNKMVNSNPEQFRVPSGEKKTWKWWTMMTFIFFLLIIKIIVFICVMEGIIKV